MTWLLTAGGGFLLLATWIRNGGTRRAGASRFPPALIFGHFALAAAGLIVWIVYLFTDQHALAWTAFVLLLPVALLGFTMLARWIPTYRATAAVHAGTATSATGARPVPADTPAEKHFPVAVVAGHGLFAVATVVLVLLAALEIGG